MSSLQGVRDTILAQGLFSSFYSDRGGHYWYTPQAGGKVNKARPTQFGRALKQLGIEMIAAYSPEARGRSERAFGTHQGRLPNELALAGITDMTAANRYLRDVYMPAFNVEFAPARDRRAGICAVDRHQSATTYCANSTSASSALTTAVQFEGRSLQIPQDRNRCHYVRARVRVHRHANGQLALFHGPRRLATYNADGQPAEQIEVAA